MEENDPILRDILRSDGNHVAHAAAVERLFVEHLNSLMAAEIRKALGMVTGGRPVASETQEVEDIFCTARGRVLIQLWRAHTEGYKYRICNLGAYTRAAARHAGFDYLRVKRPAWNSVRGRLVRAAERSCSLSVWRTADGVLVCGASELAAACAAPAITAGYDSLFDDPRRFAAERGVDPADLTTLVAALVCAAGGSLLLDDLIGAVVTLLPESGECSLAIADEIDSVGRSVSGATIPGANKDAAELTIEHVYVEQLWEEICLLPMNQRRAMVAKYEMITLLVVTGVANISQIEHVLGLDQRQMEEVLTIRFSDDTALADWMHLTRQQVINLHKCARERLGRRMLKRGWAAESRT